MYKLFIDTHDKFIVYGLFFDKKLIKSVEYESLNKHGSSAMPLLKSLFDECKLKPKDISEIIVVIGPGSFTGVRIGVSIAKMLSYTLNVPIKTINSLQLYSLNYLNEFTILTINDQKGVYFGLFDKGVQIDELQYLSTDEFLKFLKNNNYENIVNKCEVINFDNLIKYVDKLTPENVHAVKPIYVKVIEALK